MVNQRRQGQAGIAIGLLIAFILLSILIIAFIAMSSSGGTSATAGRAAQLAGGQILDGSKLFQQLSSVITAEGGNAHNVYLVNNTATLSGTLPASGVYRAYDVTPGSGGFDMPVPPIKGFDGLAANGGVCNSVSAIASCYDHWFIVKNNWVPGVGATGVANAAGTIVAPTTPDVLVGVAHLSLDACAAINNALFGARASGDTWLPVLSLGNLGGYHIGSSVAVDSAPSSLTRLVPAGNNVPTSPTGSIVSGELNVYGAPAFCGVVTGTPNNYVFVSVIGRT